MKKISLSSFLFFLIFKSFSQELVPNGDFEKFDSIPYDRAQWYFCNSWYNVNGNHSIDGKNGATPDYFSTQSKDLNYKLPNTGGLAYVFPYSGEAMTGLFMYGKLDTTINKSYREYLFTKLNHPLVKGAKYRVSFAFTLGQDYIYYRNGVDRFGIRFSIDSVKQKLNEAVSLKPQVERKQEYFQENPWGWNYFSKIYTADSAYQYLTFGNMYDDSLTQRYDYYNYGITKMSYYFIDNISVLPIQANAKYEICKGDSLVLKAPPYTVYKWVNSASPDSVLSVNDSLKIKPKINTTYWLLYNYNDTARFEVKVIARSDADMLPDTSICEGQKITLNIRNPKDSVYYTWKNLQNNKSFYAGKTITTPFAGDYVVTFYDHECIYKDTFFVINYNRFYSSQLKQNICENQTLKLNASNSNSLNPYKKNEYLWYNGSTDSVLSVNSSGLYPFAYKTEHCTFLDTFFVQKAFSPKILHIPHDTTICAPYFIYEPPIQNYYFNITGMLYNAPYLAVNQSGVSKYSYFQRVNGKNTCSIFDSINVNIYFMPKDFLSKEVSICNGDSVDLMPYKYANLNYEWQDKRHDTIYYAKKTGEYILKLTNKMNPSCFASDTTNLKVLPIPNQIKISDTSLCDFKILQLKHNSKNLYNLIWWDNSSDSIKIIKDNGNYSYTVSNSCGYLMDTFSVNYINCKLFIPNIFTPNKDEHNQTFELLNIENNPCKVKIFNRWGEEIYSKESYDNSWEGDNVSDGIYFYKIFNKRTKEELKGWVQISR